MFSALAALGNNRFSFRRWPPGGRRRSLRGLPDDQTGSIRCGGRLDGGLFYVWGGSGSLLQDPTCRLSRVLRAGNEHRASRRKQHAKGQERLLLHNDEGIGLSIPSI